MDILDKTARDIKSLKIQGAENIAKYSVNALMKKFSGKKFKKRESFLKTLDTSIKKLAFARPTEPMLRNSLYFITRETGSGDNPDELKNSLFHACRQALYHFEVSEKTIAEIGVKKIESGMKIFTHCHSSSVVSTLKLAKDQGKDFSVLNTETRPMFQGRITARELSKLRIPVKHYVDSGARLAIKEADIVLFGCDAITSEGKVINKIGSEMFAIIADRLDKPVYILTDSWKFDPKSIFGFPEPIERRESKEIWDRPPKGVEIRNPAFEKIHPDLITAIISELGDFPPEVFVSEVRKAYPWLTGSQ